MTDHTNANSRSIRIFVSSTFRDMVEERDDLMTHAWPARTHSAGGLLEFLDPAPQ